MTYHQPIRSDAGLTALSRVRGFVDELPEVLEQIDKFGHTSFRIRDKPFVMMGEDPDHCWLSIKADGYTQEFLLKRDCFTKTPYIGQHGWTSVRTDQVPDWDEIQALITQAFARVAPARVRRQIEEDSSG